MNRHITATIAALLVWLTVEGLLILALRFGHPFSADRWKARLNAHCEA